MFLEEFNHKMVEHVPEHIDFSKQEESTLLLWKSLDAFKKSCEFSKSRPKFSFYDGPPFATGVPHYGHVLAGTIKDIMTRWAHQSGFHVNRRFGWDCHGLPVEYEIDKMLNIRGPEDVQKMGIAKYNDECRKIVMRYSSIWKEQMTRLGRWIDFENDYKTMNCSFMESVWWVFKELYSKGLVYRGHKIMPFSTACGTPLSNFECGQNYKDTRDPSIIVTFPLQDTPDTAMLAWTTTPWTLPSNMSLCVHPEKIYAKILIKSSNEKFILMESRLVTLFKSSEEYEILESFPGSSLEGKKYEPLFDYFVRELKDRGAFSVLIDAYVSDENGTGIVHQAPYFGEDDYRVAMRYGIITKDSEPICPIDMSGRFVEPVSDFEGQHVKEADKNIIKWLKEQNRLFRHETIIHSYPFCWRSDTPLIYRAIPSWFVRVEQAIDQLLESNAQTRWVPDFVKEKRFGNWLREARDWAISRNRYWGTPIPLWVSDDFKEVVCVGSIDELKKLTGITNINDLHREFIDELTIPSATGDGLLRRIPEVFDCWFESGAMPYAQNHYPFENKEEFDQTFPADFIAEGIDQTRGWFYTLLVQSTLLFGKPPFKNLICHGLVLAADGQKMSKRKRNYPDIMEVVSKYGSDAIRLYLVNSPVVQADNLKFKEEGVRDIVKNVLLPLYNAYRFLIQNVIHFQTENGLKIEHQESTIRPNNYTDRWILSLAQSLIKFVRAEMEAYRLYTVLPPVLKFINQLTNWYIRMNRSRLRGETDTQDCYEGLTTLCFVLLAITKLMAPFIPFITEHIYQNLRHLIKSEMSEEETLSVHYQMLPIVKENLIDVEIEMAVSRVQSVIDLGRAIRERRNLPIKYPLKEIVVIHENQEFLRNVMQLENYVIEELNVRKVTTTSDWEKYRVRLRTKPNYKMLGERLKGAFKDIANAIENLTDDQLREFQLVGEMELLNEKLTRDDLRLIFSCENDKEGKCKFEANTDSNVLVLIDVSDDQSMIDEGVAREVISRIQRLRKRAKLQTTDDITIYYKTSGELTRVISEYKNLILATVKQPLVSTEPSDSAALIEEEFSVKNDKLHLAIFRRT